MKGLNMKITQIEINKLHKKNNKKISLNKDINLLYGSNGSGKTTVLNILASILTGEIYKLSIYEFKNIKIEYSNEFLQDRKIINISQLELYSYKLMYDNKEYNINMFENNIFFEREIGEDTYKINFFKKFPICRKIRDTFNCLYLPLDRVNVYNDIYYDDKYNSIRIFRRNHSLTNRFLKQDTGLDKVQEMVMQCYIKASREMESNTNKFKNQLLKSLVSLKPINLEKVILELLQTKNIHKKIDKYINILIENKIIEKEDIKEYNIFFSNFFQQLEEQRNHNSGIYLNSELLFNIFEVSKMDSIIGLAESLEKDNNNIFRSITLFMDTINEFLSTYDQIKLMRIDQKGELVIIDTNSNQKIDISYLSSGEKQIITFFAYLIFGIETKKPAIVIVDEPELSLHLSWQKLFISKALEVNKNAQYICATHAPEIVGKFRDYTINIKG